MFVGLIAVIILLGICFAAAVICTVFAEYVKGEDDEGNN
jgi:hypothetical protein